MCSSDLCSDIPVERHREFANTIGEALKSGGDVLIPAYTLGRTQEVIAVIDWYMDKGVMPFGTIVYTDSPTAEKITGVYRDYPGELSDWAKYFYKDKILKKSQLRETKSSLSVRVHDRIHKPSIFVSSSGDLQHASSPKHLMKMFDNEKNLLCIVGWQPPGSLGRRLAEGEKNVLVHYRDKGKARKDWISPLIQVKEFHCFSGHADQNALLDWLRNIKGVQKVFLIHGEVDQAELLAEKIGNQFNIDAVIPRLGDRIVLSAD